MNLSPDYAKLKGNIASVTTTGKKTVIKIEVSNQLAAKNYPFLSQNIEKEVDMMFGSGQIAMQLPEQPDRGLGYSTDSHGVVGTVRPADDNGQGDLFSRQPGEPGAEETDESESVENENEDEEADTADEDPEEEDLEAEEETQEPSEQGTDQAENGNPEHTNDDLKWMNFEDETAGQPA